MPPLPVVPRCFELKFIMSDGGDLDIQNRTFWSFTGALSSTDLTTITAAAFAQFGTHMMPNFRIPTTLEEVSGNDLSSLSGAQAFTTGSTPGTNPGTGSLTSGACFVLSFEGALKYRGGHSRIYFSGYPNNDLADPNTWTTGTVTNTVSAWTAFRNALIAAIPSAVGVVAQVIAHRYGATAGSPVLAGGATVRKSVPLTNPFTEPVVAVRGNPQVGSQRRRNLYVA
jgi:hypothetical protein